MRQVTVTNYDAAGHITSTQTITIPTTLEQDNSDTLTSAATNALTTNRNFIALATPTNPQLAAQVTALTRQNTALIRLVLGLLDGVN